MPKKDDIIELTIDSLAYGGAGVGKVDGFPVFVDDSAPEDVLKVKITSNRDTYAWAEIVEVVTPSPFRVEPECAMLKVCGGCNWQHVEYGEQLNAKKKIVEDNIRKISGLDIPVREVIPSDQIYKYRCKIQNPVQQTQVSKRFLLGYYKHGSHDLVNIKYCPIQPDIIGEITEYIRNKGQELGLSGYDENRKCGLLRHVVFRYSMTNENLLVIFVVNSDKAGDNLVRLARAVRNEFPEVVGALVNFNLRHTNVIFGDKTVLIDGQDYVEENLEGRLYRISAGSFFQVNPRSAVKMFNTVRDMIVARKLENPSILDVYAGVGSFAIWLKDIASTMTAIEEYPRAVADAKINMTLNEGINGAPIKFIEGNADKILESMARTGKKFDVLVLDPPRKGCVKGALEAAAILAEKNIIYVSCNPATLARDLKILDDLGFSTEYVQPVDMFCHTYHVESIALLSRRL